MQTALGGEPGGAATEGDREGTPEGLWEGRELMLTRCGGRGVGRWAQP